MIICGERRTDQSSDMGWSPLGAGCVNGARPVLGGGEAQSIKSMLYVSFERESPLYSPGVPEGPTQSCGPGKLLSTGSFRDVLD